MVILIEGPINSGKTTVSKLLAQRLAKTVHVEIDELRHFADCLTLDEAIPFALEDAICITRNWVARGFHVVVSWPFSPENYRRFADAMRAAGANLLTFTLLPREDVCIANRGSRPLEQHEVSRIKEMYQSYRERLPIGTVIDNSEQTPDETVEVVLSLIPEVG